jgi:hypothetical protein
MADSGKTARQPGEHGRDSDEEPPAGGLTAVLDRLRDAAAAHDDDIDQAHSG